MDKRSLSERDICSKFIAPALRDAGWDEISQIREEVPFTRGRIIVRGKLVTRGQARRADYILYYKPNIPLAVIEAIAKGQDRVLLVMAQLSTNAKTIERPGGASAAPSRGAAGSRLMVKSDRSLAGARPCTR